jgi:hypothetical protein
MAMPIHVTAYSGFKGNERPCSFLIGGQLYEIEEVLKCWYEPSCTCFKVVTTDGRLFVLRCADVWTVGDEYDGAALLSNIDIVLVDVADVRKAESLIISCEHCYPADASMPFDWLLAHVTGKRGLFRFLMAEVPRCPGCNHLVTEGTLVERKD